MSAGSVPRSRASAAARSHWFSIGRWAAVAAVAALAAACGGTTGDDDVPVEVTYYQDLKPVVDAKCGGCHVADGIAPFALTTFDDMINAAGMAVEAVEDRIMPPWPPDAACNEYFGDRSLTDAQIALFRAWVEGGYQMGDPANPGQPIETEQIRMSRVDMTLSMPVEYTPVTTPEQPDEYRCFVIPWTETTTRYVTGFRAVPGNPKVVHHVIAFYAEPGLLATYQQLDADEAGPGYTCFGGPGGPARTWIGGWAPGSEGSDTPAGTGIRMEPGATIILQVHYNVLEAGPQPDLTKVELKLDDTVDQVAVVQPWANPQWLDSQLMRIPAGEPDVMHSFAFDATFVVGGPFTIWAPALHMHELGTRATTRIIRSTGERECLLAIQRWDFHWQGSYGLRQPIHFNQGDQLEVECHWDNSPTNQPLVGGQPRVPTDVYWGDGTTDEMCLGVFYVTRDP